MSLVCRVIFRLPFGGGVMDKAAWFSGCLFCAVYALSGGM
ncbi:hypothetical protein GCWU000324_01246 [Kingella oralis ATCC 51147]|uniref:Uncharacterized protein n=1 Tax=Kingella oralis ATCC 51147 TaxID=629741 RepID=C4GGH9_9NEIS|nr:hypothetical protein GCWU000324_01246 [Kingella oralis ATCC 51147]